MSCRIHIIILIGVNFWLCDVSQAQNKATSAIPSSSAILAQDEVLPPEMAAERKAAVQNQLEALERSNVPKEERDTARVPLDEMLNLLNALEDARKRYATFREQLGTLPQRLRELVAAQKKLDARSPGQFPHVTEVLRDRYNVQLHTVQAELQDLIKQNSTAETSFEEIKQQLRAFTAWLYKAEDHLYSDDRQVATRLDGLLPPGQTLTTTLRQAFDERGIEMPFPHRTVYWGMPKENPQPPIHISLDPPSPSQRADNGFPGRVERPPPPIIED